MTSASEQHEAEISAPELARIRGWPRRRAQRFMKKLYRELGPSVVHPRPAQWGRTQLFASREVLQRYGAFTMPDGEKVNVTLAGVHRRLEAVESLEPGTLVARQLEILRSALVYLAQGKTEAALEVLDE